MYLFCTQFGRNTKYCGNKKKKPQYIAALIVGAEGGT